MEHKAKNIRTTEKSRTRPAKASGRKTRQVASPAGYRKAEAGEHILTRGGARPLELSSETQQTGQSTSKSTGVLRGTVLPAGNMKRGFRGPAVRQLQGALVKLRLMTQQQVDTGPGSFGPRTEAALKKFQATKGMPSSGLYGPATRMAFTRLGARIASTPPPPKPPPGTFPPPRGLAAIKATFGVAGKNMVTTRLPLGAGGKPVIVTLHRKMLPLMQRCLLDAQRKGLLKHIKSFHGMYPGFVRNKRDPTGKELRPPQPSVHSWGIAFDINAKPRPVKVHPALVKHFKRWRFTWGGDFKRNVDPMHFQYASGY
jgi:D-alanyl-D-alanine carboxypeptidase-like protein/putative peptidoglycan binding protein